MLNYLLFVILIVFSYSTICTVEPRQNSTLQWIVQKNITSNLFPLGIYKRNFTQILNFTSAWSESSIVLPPSIIPGYEVFWLPSPNQSFVGDMNFIVNSEKENCTFNKVLSFFKPPNRPRELTSFTFVYEYYLKTSRTLIDSKWEKSGTKGKATIKVDASWDQARCEFANIYEIEKWDEILQVFPMDFEQWETWDYIESRKDDFGCPRKGSFITMNMYFSNGETKSLFYYKKENDCEVTNTVSTQKGTIEGFVRIFGTKVCKIFGYDNPRVCLISPDFSREFPIEDRCPKPYEDAMKAFVGVFASAIIILSCCSCLCFFLCILICRKRLFSPKEPRKVVTHFNEEDEEIEIELYNQKSV